MKAELRPARRAKAGIAATGSRQAGAQRAAAPTSRRRDTRERRAQDCVAIRRHRAGADADDARAESHPARRRRLINVVRQLGLVYDNTVYMDNDVPAGQALLKVGKKLRK